MFYVDPYENQLRLGDVLIQQTTISSKLSTSRLPDDNTAKFEIEVKKPSFAVVLTPCCSIDNNIIVITPLKRINKNYFRNPYLAEDLMRINRKIDPEKRLPPIAWEKLLEEERVNLKEGGQDYPFVDVFIYDQNEQLPKYTIMVGEGENRSEKELGYYEIDFRNVSIINSENIKADNSSFVVNKVAQLSVDARSELRNKIASYYSRIPNEDLELMD